jgi:hypothetical protein
MGTQEYDEVTGQDMINLAINHIEVGNTVVEEAYMTEIQLRRIVERTAKDEINQLSDGDETMIKDGERISKFSTQAVGLGKDVYAEEGSAPFILKRIYLIYDKYVGLVIQWISKEWTTHELQLPVFYREALGRLLALEKFRNLIETNIEAGITLYTDHKPALFENSLSNKG